MNIEKAKEEFLKYTNKFDINEEAIKRKIEHSLRVMEISKKLAKQIGLSEEDVNLATLIGLLHDIARFEQYTLFKTYNDLNSIDHGDFGVAILKEKNYIRKYIKEDQYDDIIFKAVKNHNKYKIEKELTEKELLFIKIIRDADKLDIYYESTGIFWNTKKSERILKNQT